jgi:hypothetical protein
MFLIHTPPEHAEIVARAVVGACRLEGWQSPLQPRLLHTLFNRLLGQELDCAKIEPLSPTKVAGTLTTPVKRRGFQHGSTARRRLLPARQRSPGGNSRKVRYSAQEPENSQARSVRSYEVAVRPVGANLSSSGIRSTFPEFRKRGSM